MIDSHINKTREKPPYQVREPIRKIHDQLTIVDLHADALLWDRDLLVRNDQGHVDLPRLIEGNIALQVFGVVTKFPFGINIKNLSLHVDLVTLLSRVNKWPQTTRRDLLERALHQSQKLNGFINHSAGRMMLIRSIKDLGHFLTLRKAEPGLVGSLLALEGVHALNGELSNLKKLYDASFRILGIAHFFDNEAGGSMHSRFNRGLSSFGRELVHAAQKLHMLIDLAHASSRVLDEVTELTSDPVIVSHTGARGICDNPRNLSDSQIQKIANTGGMIGIAAFKRVVCGDHIKDVARSMRYVADVVGVDHVGLGSDFDGAITAPVDVSGLPLLTEELLTQGFDDGQIASIMGGNALRVLQAVLPRE